ncbi:MAG: GNAT family N-acetyltransferase [Geminicoccaceae bacterium]
MKTEQGFSVSPGLGRALWWAYEHAPGHLDPVFQFGRRYVAAFFRHRLPLYRLSGFSPADGRKVTVITAGAAMTLDFLVERIFTTRPRAQHLGMVSLARLPGTLERIGADADLTLACVPRAMARWCGGDRYLRVPALVSFRLGIGAHLESTLGAAAYNVRRDARRTVEAGYGWALSREPGDFDRFYHEFYAPFVRQRFGPLAVLREPPELRRHFRHGGGIIWVRHAGRVVAGGLVRVGRGELRALVEAVHPSWRSEVKPSPQFAVNIATFDIASELGIDVMDLGGTAPSLRDGVFRTKRAWGAAVQISAESHRQLLLRWSPGGNALLPLLQAAPLLFEARGRLSAMAAVEPGQKADLAAGQELWRKLAPTGLDRLYLLDTTGTGHDLEVDMRTPDGRIRVCSPRDAASLNQVAARDD